MVTPENLSMILFALKDAGVRRAKFGDVEIEFEPVEEPAPAPMTAVDLPAARPPAPHITEVAAQFAKHSGYAALFGAETPRFRPADE